MGSFSPEAEGSVEIMVRVEREVAPLLEERDSVRVKEAFIAFGVKPGLPASCSGYMAASFGLTGE